MPQHLTNEQAATSNQGLPPISQIMPVSSIPTAPVPADVTPMAMPASQVPETLQQ